MKEEKWIICWLSIVLVSLAFIFVLVYFVDPYFHYHYPQTDVFYYDLDSERFQNDGICKQFDYDVLVTGTSMTENFLTSEVDKVFKCKSIKVPYSGGSYKEINDNIQRALEANPNIEMVIRSIDMMDVYVITDDEGGMNTYMKDLPYYLYDDSFYNDCYYFLNRDVLFGRVCSMIQERNNSDFAPGIMSFDQYARWQWDYVYGAQSVAPTGTFINENIDVQHLAEEEKQIIEKNIKENITDIADNNPDVEFYYFYPPYSIEAWNDWKNEGKLYKQLEIKEYMTGLIIPHPNIHLFSFNNRSDITTDLNNYKDNWHYASWINSLILKWMKNGDGHLTQNTYKEALKEEYDFYTSYDYSLIDKQTDYEMDVYAAALLNYELNNAIPIDVLNDKNCSITLFDSEMLKQDQENKGVVLKNDSSSSDKNNIGFEILASLDDRYQYLCCYGQMVEGNADLEIKVFDESGRMVLIDKIEGFETDGSKHQYALDHLPDGNITILFEADKNDDGYLEYQFSDIYIY